MWDCADLAAAMAHRHRRIAAGGTTWDGLVAEGREAAAREPMLMRTLEHGLLAHESFADALAHRLAHKLEDADLGAACLAPLILEAMEDDPEIPAAAAEDLLAVRDRDPSITDLLTAFLYFDVCFSVWVVNGAMAPFISQEFHLTAAQKGFMVSVPVFSGALMRFPLGILAQYIGRKRAALLEMGIICACLVWGYFFTTSLGAVLASVDRRAAR